MRIRNPFSDDVVGLLILGAIGVGIYYVWKHYGGSAPAAVAAIASGNTDMGGQAFGTPAASANSTTWN